MPLYEYSATDARGRRVQGLVAAASRAIAHEKLKGRGYFPTSIQEDRGGARGRPGGEALAYTLVQFAALLQSGIPMDEALATLAEHGEAGRLGRALARVRQRLREGESLAGAMAEDEAFPPMLVRMVGAGEEAGRPALVIERYARYLQQELEHRRNLQSALTYPLLLVGVSVLLLLGLLTFLTPVVQEMYATLGQELSLITRAMVATGTFLRAWGLPLLAALAGVIFLTLRLVPRAALDAWKLRLPLLGSMLLCAVLGRWTRTLGMLHAAGVPLVRAMQMAREVVDNQALKDQLARAERAVEHGEGVGAALSRVYLIPPLLQQFLRTGEKSGELEPMLERAAEFYERELERRRSLLVRWLEPSLIVAMGLLVGLLVLSVLLPLADLATRLS